MILKLSTWLIVALACGALVAGCGSGGSTSSSPTSSSKSGATGGSPLTAAQQKEATETCKHGIQSQSKISASAKAKLEGICDKAATSGSTAALQTVAQELCRELVKASHVPAGAARDQALEICKAK
jgi:translation initiation factor IF-2